MKIFIFTLSLLVAAGCASAPRAPGDHDDSGPVAGFVVYAADGAGGYETILVPVKTAAAPFTNALKGLWVYETESEHLGAAAIPDCDCPEFCEAFGDAAWTPPDSLRDSFGACVDPTWQGIVGGTIFGAQETHSDVCATGLNMYGVESSAHTLGSTPYSVAQFIGEEGAVYHTCAEDSAVPGEPDATYGVDCTTVGADLDEGDDLEGPDDAASCEICTSRYDWGSEVPRIMSGLVVLVRDSWNVVGSGPHETSAWPLSKASCPSPSDTCGDPAAFAHVPNVKPALDAKTSFGDRLAKPFWINNDDTFVLTEDATDGWALWSRAQGAGPRAVPQLAKASALGRSGTGAVLGVRWLADLRGLVQRSCAALCHAPDVPQSEIEAHADDEEPYPYTNMCEAYYSLAHVCEGPVDEDNCTYGMDLEDSGGEDGSEGEGIDGEDEAPPESRDVPPTNPSPKEAPIDTRTSRELGNACFEHIKSGALELAQAECNLALVRADNDKSRGALHFNLGLIAETRGETAKARAAYETSLRLRPGNATVKERLDSL